jgi:hypothetical protein
VLFGVQPGQHLVAIGPCCLHHLMVAA